MKTYTLLVCLIGITLANVHFKDEFAAGWESKWVESTHKGAEQGKFVHSAGKYFADEEADKGIQTSENARFYGISSKFDKFTNTGKDLVIQFSVKHEQDIDCGGGYIKVFSDKLDQTDMHGDSEYLIMFGPDICGPGTKKVHVIFNYKGKNLLIKKEIRCKDDVLTHVYTLIVKPDNTYIVKIDNEKVESGSLEEDWDFLLPKEIEDPTEKKPIEWDDKEQIDDPEDVKPEDWDLEAEHVVDPAATKPDDWDDEMDGEWEAPMIDNTKFKGVWKAKKIDNPAYKGAWVHPKIVNPKYEADDKMYSYENIGAVGFDLWQVKSGTIFDNVMVSNDEQEAEQFAKDTWGKMKDEEEKKKNTADEESRKARDELEKKEKDNEKDDEKTEDEIPEEKADEEPQADEDAHDEL